MYSLGIVTEAFLGIILTLDSWIYSLISSAYKIFMAIASARILSSDAYTAIANKVYVIVGVGMLFVLAYAIMKAIIDPDQMSKGDMAGGKILKSIAIAVIGLIVTPLLFDLAYMAQGKMLEDDILGKLFFRTGESTETINGYTFNYDEELNGTGGAVAAVSVWQAFFYPADGVDPETIIADPEIVRMNANIAAVGCAGTLAIGIAGAIGGFFTGGAGWVVAGAAVATCVGAVIADSNADKVEEAIDEEVTLAEAFSMVASGESFAIFQAFIEDIDEGNIKYTWFISTVCGAFVAYAFVSYAIDMGLRAAKLAYYQIIAPIPLILGVLPKNGDRVGKFAKAVFSTFLEVFVRISVVYIVIYIIAHLSELFSTVGALWDNDNLTNVESLVAMALLIIGLVLFAKQAPKIISDTFGLNAGNGLEGLNIMKKLRDGEVFTAGTVAGSTIRSGVQSFNSSFGRKTKMVKDPTTGKYKEVNRGLGERLAGGLGAGMFGAGSGAVRSGVGRARSGKPVGNRREMRDNVEKTTRDVHDAQNRFQDFNRVNVSTSAKAKAIGGMISDRVRNWAVGDTDIGSITRQEKAYEYIQKYKSAIEDTTGNDELVKESNSWISDLNQINAAQRLRKEIRERQARGESSREIGEALGGLSESFVNNILSYTSDDQVTSEDIRMARSAAGERLKMAKADAASRALHEAYVTGKENDTSRRAKQIFESQEWLQYASEFENLELENGQSFGDYMRSMFGEKVTVSGEIDFETMFSKEAGLSGGSRHVRYVIKDKGSNSDGHNAISNAIGTNSLENYEVEFDYTTNTARILDISGGPGHEVEVASGIDISQISKYGIDVKTDRTIEGASKKGIGKSVKDTFETEGDVFAKKESIIQAKQAARQQQADKNKPGK